MRGTRPLDNTEIIQVADCFDGTFEVRNRCLFMLGVSTGGRISELLSLQIGNVWQNGKPVKDLLFARSIVKGGEVSRAVPVNIDGRQAIEDLIAWHRDRYENTAPHRPLFPSRNGQGKKKMTTRAGHNLLKKAFDEAGLNGHLATHSLRKSFAQRLYDRTGDIFAVQEMLGHKSVATTQKYLGVSCSSSFISPPAMVGGWQKRKKDSAHCSATQTGFKSISDGRKIGKSIFDSPRLASRLLSNGGYTPRLK